VLSCTVGELKAISQRGLVGIVRLPPDSKIMIMSMGIGAHRCLQWWRRAQSRGYNPRS
jgi:hypothetical protein